MYLDIEKVIDKTVLNKIKESRLTGANVMLMFFTYDVETNWIYYSNVYQGWLLEVLTFVVFSTI